MRIGLAIVVATASAAASPRPGRVVRIERAMHRSAGNPRMCAIPTLDDTHAYCFGVPPAIGDPIDIVDINHYIGRVRAKTVAPINAMGGACKGTDANIWQVEIEVDGELATDADARQIAGLIDVPLDARRAHLVKIEQPPRGMTSADSMEMAFGVDSDGDGRIDVEFVLAHCDDPGAHGQCFDTWLDPDGSSPQRLRRETFPEGCF